MRTARSWFTLGTLLTLSQMALAVDVPFSGTLTANDPVFNRTVTGNPPGGLSAVGTAVSYDVFAFYVTANSTYVAETLSANFTIPVTGDTADDTFIIIYQTAFNPASPLTNAIIADDDTGVGALSFATKALTAGTQYYLVVTSFDNAQLGPYTGHLNSTTGVGQVVLGTVPVPEVSTAILMLFGLGAAGFAARASRRC